ncbi:MAG TPA: acetyl-coenzyme A synthetase N-terminal domain-containing protein, partial [Thermodesulfobacteriota bacterium]|nr:acetyl-coenzyme A synthetase N-terminal domain-containing protein [Thermodesulfobacteriota bacterium]
MEVKAKPIEALLEEARSFPPPKKLRASAHVKDNSVYKKAERNREAFWEGFAKELHWYKKWKKVLDWKAPYSKWFVGGKINV